MAPRKQTSYSPWRKAILVPCWVAQTVFGLALIILLSLELGAVVSYQNGKDDTLHKEVNIIGSITIAVTALCLVSTVAEVLLLRRQSLKPGLFLTINLVKSSIWTVLFVADIIAIVRKNHKTATISGVVLEVVLLISFHLPVVHSMLVWSDHRHCPSYASVDPPLMTQSQPNPHWSVNSRTSNLSYETYASIPSIGNTTDIDLESQPTTLPPSEPEPEPQPKAESTPQSPPPASSNLSRRPSYNHARDPRFDQFLARRASSASRISDVGAESVYSGSGRPSLASSWGSYTYLGRMGAYDELPVEDGGDIGLGVVRPREEIGIADGGEEEPRLPIRDLTRRKSSGTPIIIAIHEAEEER